MVSTRVDDWPQFKHLIETSSIKLIAFDLRGTLIIPPRVNHLSRCANDILAGGIWPEDIDSEIPKRILEKYLTNTLVYDWTLLTALELASFGTENNLDITTADATRAYQRLRSEYIEESKPLVSDSAFESLILFCKQFGIRTVVCADGFADVERAVFSRLFPRSTTLVDAVVGSDSVESNKLSAIYFSRLSSHFGFLPEDLLVVGDRADKDIRFASEAGCKTLLISQAENQVGAASVAMDKILPIEPELLPTGVVLGRFQPFHLEHLRLVLAAMRRAKKLFIGITQPFPRTLSEPGEERSIRAANPLPYWLREKCILASLEDCHIPHDRFTIVPSPLQPECLAELFPPGTTVFTTVFDQWGDQKEDILRHGGLYVERMELGAKTIASTNIRRLIKSRNQSWKSQVPKAISTTFAQDIEKFVHSS